MKKYLPLSLILALLLPLAVHAGPPGKKGASLVVEYGLDSLERRFYRPIFRFDLPFIKGTFFSEVQYLSRMNGRLQGAIDYWVDAGWRKNIRGNLSLEFRLNHFCRHNTVRDSPYIWNVNEVLARVGLAGEKFDLALAAGGYIGSSPGYRDLLVLNGEWRGFIVPELSLSAEVKMVNFSRFYHELGFSLALNRNVDLFFKNTRNYEFPNASYLGLRFKADGQSETFLDSLKMSAGVSPFDNRYKLEVEGGYKLEFFENGSRRVVLGVDFETPILNGNGFFAQFWPAKMLYGIGLDYEWRINPSLFVAWAARYQLDMPVDEHLPFTASLFTGLAVRNQANFDELEKEVRYELVAGHDFKRGPGVSGKLGVQFWRSGHLRLFAEMRTQVDGKRARNDFRLLAGFGRVVQIRPFIGWKKDLAVNSVQPVPGKFLFGLGFFKKF